MKKREHFIFLKRYEQNKVADFFTFWRAKYKHIMIYFLANGKTIMPYRIYKHKANGFL